ncbi:unnamed protein product, partial [Didymodactylos carnosus]
KVKEVLAKTTEEPDIVATVPASQEPQIQHTCTDDDTDSKSVISTIIVPHDETKDVNSNDVQATLSSTIEDKCKDDLSIQGKDENTIQSVDVTKVTKLNDTHSSIEVKTT